MSKLFSSTQWSRVIWCLHFFCLFVYFLSERGVTLKRSSSPAAVLKGEREEKSNRAISPCRGLPQTIMKSFSHFLIRACILDLDTGQSRLQ